MSILISSSFFIFLVYISMHSCNARPSAMLSNPDSAENKVKITVDSSVNHGTNVGDIKTSMKKAEEYEIEGHVNKMKVNGRKEAMNQQNVTKKHARNENDKTSLGFESADYPQPRTHPPSHN